jgi:diaminohydroxyphosphoribosylaminopyrimidine deaminase / 5-amino-6-(5-phosphoribosylamino)uracil reductase
MVTPADTLQMDRALLLARRGLGRTSPNPMVGAVVVTAEGVVAGMGYHEAAGRPHAEVRALAVAGGRARGATLYCTLEPCCHTGRTGPCTPRVIEAGIARVVAATLDPNPLVRGRGVAALRAHGIRVDVGLRQAEAERLNDPFFSLMRRRRPFVTAKVALSCEARVAGAGGAPVRLTSAVATRRVHQLRAEADAVAVGSGTVLTDDPLLTVREVFREAPLTRVVFDSRLRTPPGAKLLSTLASDPVIIVTTAEAVGRLPRRADALTRAGVALDVLPHRDLGLALERLGARGVASLLLEGGPGLHAAAWRAALVDRLQIFVSPVSVGASGVPWLGPDIVPLGALRAPRVEVLGPDVVIDAYVHRTD